MIVSLIRETMTTLLDYLGSPPSPGARIMNITTERYNIEPAELLKFEFGLRRHRRGMKGQMRVVRPKKLENALTQYLTWNRMYGSLLQEMPCAAECSSLDRCLKTGFDDVILYTQRLTRSCRVVFYTVAFA